MSILELPDASLCVRLAATMGHFLWQGAAVYLLVILAGLLLRRSTAGARYAVFAAALLVMAACPPVTFVLLRSPETPAISGGQSLPHVRSEVETPSAFLGGQSPPYLGRQGPPYELGAVPPPAEPVSLAVPDEPAVEAIDWWRYAPWLVACYLGGTTLMFARLLVALCGGQRLRRRSEPVDDSAILAAFARQAGALGLRFTPAIAFCRDVAVPTVVGVLRPMILLPLSAVSGLTTEQIEVLLAHELAHIRRYDHLVNIVQRLIEAVLFFHPAVWFVSRRIRIEREHCCDDLVLAVGGQRFAYAESLVRMAELSKGGQSPPYMAAAAAALGAADRPSQLRLRILRLVSGNTGEQVRLLRPAVLGLCLFLMLAAAACVQLASRPTEDRPIEAVPPGMVGTWFFENPMGDDEQMAVFPDGRVVVLYSNGHRDETRYADGTIELAEYGNIKAKLVFVPDGTLQTSTAHSGIAKLWQRIDAAPKTELLRPLTDSPANSSNSQPAATRDTAVGTVHLPGGSPAVDARVYAMTKGEFDWFHFKDGKLDPSGANRAVTTDVDGRFVVSVRDKTYAIAAIHSAGWGLLARRPLPAEITIKLVPWGRVEGILRTGRTLGADRDIEVTSWPAKAGKDNGFVFSQNVTTNADGRFVLDQVPPGEAEISVQVGKATEPSIFAAAGAPSMYVEVQPGKTTSMEIGGAGRPVVGRVVPPPGTTAKIDWVMTFRHLRLRQPPVPYPPGLSREQKDEWLEQWQKTPAGRARHLAYRAYGFEIKPDGSFRIEDVPHGRYHLGIILYAEGRRPPATSPSEDPVEAGSVSIEVVVPEMPGGRSDKPLDLGILEAKDASATSRPATQPVARQPVSEALRSVDRIVTVSLGQPEAPGGGSRAWYVLRQSNCGPLLRDLPLQLAKMNDPAVRASAVWQGHDGGMPLEIDVRLEDGATGEMLIGLFTDDKWSQMPVRVAEITGGGRHTIKGVPPGKYQIGAMMGTLLKPKALGVHKSWPQPVEVAAGRSNVVEVLVSPQFEHALGQSYRQIAEACQPGRKVEYPDSLVQGRVTDASGKPVVHAIMQIREHTFGQRPRSIWAIDTGTDDAGHYFLDKKAGPLTISTVFEEPLPALLGSRSQFARAPGVHYRKEEINLALKPFPRGSATLRGRGVDQDGKPVQGFVISVRQEVEVNEEGEAQRTYSYRVPCWTSDGRFVLTDLSPGKHRVMGIPFDLKTYQLGFADSVAVELQDGQTSEVVVLIRRKEILYGRVLMEDGAVPPAAVKPPWPGALRISCSYKDGPMSLEAGQVDSDGCATVRLTKGDREALESGRATLSIHYPYTVGVNEKARWRSVGVLPFEELSADRAEAGVVKLRYADLPDMKPAETRPAPDEGGGRSGDLPYGTARPEAQEAIRSLASPDSDPKARETAAETLGGLREPSAVEALIAALKDEDVGVRRAAAGALGRIGDARAVDPLIEASRDRKCESFKDALWALGEIGGQQAQEAILEALREDDYGYSRAFAARALEQSGWKPADREQRIRYLLALDKWDEAVAAGPAAKPADKAANQAEGRFELDIPIVIALKTADDWRGGFPRHLVAQFKVVEKRLQAVLDVGFSSSPRTKWLMSIEVLDAAGNVLDQATATHVTSGALIRMVFLEREQIDLRFGRDVDLTKAARFRFRAEAVSTEWGNPVVFDEELPLELRLGTFENSNTVETKWIRFDRSNDRFGASVRVSLLSWPKAKYRVRVEIPGPENRVLAHAEQVIESAGVIEGGFASTSEDTLRFDLGSTEVLEETTELVRYAVRLERVDGQAEAATQPAAGADAEPQTLIEAAIVEVAGEADKLDPAAVLKLLPPGTTLERGLEAIKDLGQAEILARPNVLVASGQKTRIRIGEQFPIVKEMTTTPDGRTEPKITYMDTGLTMDLQAQWPAEDDMDRAKVTMHIRQTTMRPAEETAAPAAALLVLATREGDRVVTVETDVPTWVACTDRLLPAERPAKARTRKGEHSLTLVLLRVRHTSEPSAPATRPSLGGLEGTVLLPDGKPAVGAQVVLLLAEHEARFVDGRFDREVHNRTERRPDGISAVTDADGRFTFPEGSAFFALAILHDEGYIELPFARLTGSAITLRPWSRVEGVVLGLDKFKTSRPLDHLVTYRTYDRSGLGERGWQQENANINLRYSITPDSQGRFVLDRVPPGQCWTRREWIRPLTHGEVHQNAGEMHFETRPGQTTRVRVGAARRVVGRLLAAVDADFQIRPENSRIRYFLEAPGFHVDSSGIDPVFSAYQEFLRSDEGKAYSGDVSPAQDGSFEIRDLPPARYFMQVRVLDQSGQEGKGGKEVGLVHSGFDLTAGVGGENEPALDVGTIEVQPGEDSPKRDWGEAVEGVQCRLWAGRTHLRIGQVPEFGAGIRNRGSRELFVARSQELCELQVDGRWYRWAGAADVKSSHFAPGGEFGGISISLGPEWQAKDDGGAKLDLRPGRHTIRVAFIAQPASRDGGEPVRVISNSVVIEILPASSKDATTRPVPGSDLSAKHTVGSSGTAPRTREQEFEERARALRAEVEAETPEETVRNLSYKTYEIISSIRSPSATHGEEVIDDISRDPRVQKLLRLIREGDEAKRRALRDAVLKMVNIYLAELPDSAPANAAWRPSVMHPGGGIAYAYLLTQLDVDPVSTLKLLVDMHLRDQRACGPYLSNRSVPRPADVPKAVVATDHGAVMAFAAEQLLTTLLSRGDLQKQLTQPQLDALHRFERRPEKGWRASERQLTTLKCATEVVYPHGVPNPGFSQIVLEGPWAKGQVIDGTSKKSGIEGPVYVFDPADPKLETSRPMSARSPMLDIREIEFMNRDNYPRVDVAFQFRDGKTAGGALFEMTLLDRNKEVLGTQRVLELRNREMPEEVFASAVLGGDDPPNRSGKAELYFHDVSLTDVDSYRLIVSEPDVAGLMRVLDEKDTYPRESAARALGQIGSAAKPAVPKLTQMLDDPEPYPRDAARQALQRIGERGTGAGVPATSPAARPRVVERPRRPVTMPAVTSRDTRPLFGASHPVTQPVKDKLTVRLFPLKNARAAEIAQTVRKVLGGEVDKLRFVDDQMHGNLLTLTAAEEDLNRIAHLVAQLDKPPLANAKEPAESMERAAKVVRPEHAKASDVADTIASLYPPSSSANLRDVVMATADEKKGMVMITCDPSMEEEIEALVAQVDTANPAGVRLMRVFRVNHVDPEELRDALRGVTVPWGARCRFTADSANSLLIVEAKSAEIREIGRLIEILDIAPTHSEQTPKPSSVSRPATNPGVDVKQTPLDQRFGGRQRQPLAFWYFADDYAAARRALNEDSVPELIAILSDPARAIDWETTAKVIGYVSRDKRSVHALYEYASRKDDLAALPEDWRSRLLWGKVNAFRWMGLIDAEEATPILRKAASVDGAGEVVSRWIDDPLLPDKWGRSAIGRVQNAAVMGLIYTQRADNVEYVRRLYEEVDAEVRRVARGTLFYDGLVSAMAVESLIQEIGFDAYFRAQSSGEEPELLSPHIREYMMPVGFRPKKDNAAASQSATAPATHPAASTASDSRAGGDLDLEELEELLKRGPLSYEEARRMIRPDQAHELYPMLERLTFWEKGRNLSRVIGYVTKDEQAVRELLVYAKKTGGQYAFESIGLIGGSLADKILRLAFNGKATEEMSRGWSEEESELLLGWTIPDYLAKDVKSAAATGLVLTRKPENIALVKATYEENRVYPKDWKKRGLYPRDMNLMTEAMAVNDVIEEKGMEYYLSNLGSDTHHLGMLSPYFDKYMSWPPKEQEASAPASDSRSATRPAPSDVADVPVLDLNAGGNEKMRYFLIGPRPDERVSAAGYKLVVVLPGGNGGVDFHPFVCRLFKFGIPAGYIVAQPVAFAWAPDQQTVWPTRMSKVPGQQFATEDSVEAVIKDVRSKHKLDDRHIYTLSWSSGGPAAYAVSLAENSPVTGSFVAMSVFKPDQLPSLDRAKGRAYYLYHSPNDRVCPYRMAEEAESMLNEKAAAVTLKTYQGGHGWQGGAVYGAVRDGIKWIEKQHGDQAPSAGGGRITLFSQPSP